jgi:copper chaperone
MCTSFCKSADPPVPPVFDRFDYPRLKAVFLFLSRSGDRPCGTNPERRFAPCFFEEKVMKTLKIKGMSCQHCVKAVKKALQEIDGIDNVTVDLAKGEAVFDETRPVDAGLIREKIEKAGYELG